MFNLKSGQSKIIIVFLLVLLGGIGAFIFFQGKPCFLKKLTGCQIGFQDGTYRGTFADTDTIQIALEFKLKGGIVTEARFRHLRRDENYFIGTKEEPYRLVIA